MDKILIRVDYEEEDLEIEGNVSAIDKETDLAQERWTHDQLNAGNLFAWCWVKVTARCGPFIGSDSLGCCSYATKEDLERDLLPEMKCNAVADLKSNMQRAVADARDLALEAKRLLPKVGKLPVEMEEGS